MAVGTAKQASRRQTELLQMAWAESCKVYGYRKPHDDLVEQGESICPNRVSRLVQLAGIKAQIGYKRLGIDNESHIDEPLPIGA